MRTIAFCFASIKIVLCHKFRLLRKYVQTRHLLHHAAQISTMQIIDALSAQIVSSMKSMANLMLNEIGQHRYLYFS